MAEKNGLILQRALICKQMSTSYNIWFFPRTSVEATLQVFYDKEYLIKMKLPRTYKSITKFLRQIVMEKLERTKDNCQNNCSPKNLRTKET